MDKRAGILALGGTTLLGAIASYLLWPVDTQTAIVEPRPALSYAAALEHFEHLRLRDTPEINPVCHSELLVHAQRTPLAIILLHGLTNCPRQFYPLGVELYRRGHNVLIPRMTYHGLSDRMNPLLARLTAHDILKHASGAVDIAAGLGKRVVLAGISQGATAAARLAYQRKDIDRLVLLAPFFGIKGIPPRLTPLVRNILLRTPNQFLWWDKQARELLAGPTYAYPRFATRAVGEALRLATSLQKLLQQQAPATRAISVITTAADASVNNAATGDIVAAWRRWAPTRIHSYEFAAERCVAHDMIDPNQPDQHCAEAYPVIIEALERN
jgi:pimeloyl-ACP methyl ester carboxylesterase